MLGVGGVVGGKRDVVRIGGGGDSLMDDSGDEGGSLGIRARHLA